MSGINGVDHMEQLMNSQQYSDLLPPTTSIPDQHHHLVASMKQRIPAGSSYPDEEVIAISPTTLIDENRFVCDLCFKGFPREQNLQLHRRGHNLPFKLKTSTTKDVARRRVYLCPEPTCTHHNRSHALGDFAGLRKHYFRKHCEKKYVCNKCSKMYAVQSDLKAHRRSCGTKKYNCACGAGFSSRYSFLFHQESCDTLAQEGAARHPPTLGADTLFESITNNNSSSHRDFTMAHLGPQSSSFQNLTNSFTSITPNQSQLCCLGTDHRSITGAQSMDLNFCNFSPSFFTPSSSQQNQHEFQVNVDTGFHPDQMSDNIMHNNVNLESSVFVQDDNYGCGKGPSSFSDQGIVLDCSSSLNSTSAVHNNSLMPQLLATGLVPKEDPLGSTFRNNCATNIAQGYASSLSGGSVGGFIMPEEQSFHFGSGDFAIAANNGYNTNLYELLNPASDAGVGSSIVNPYVGGNYKQGDYYCHGDCFSHHDSSGGKTMYNFKQSQQPQLQNTRINMGFERSGGFTLTE